MWRVVARSNHKAWQYAKHAVYSGHRGLRMQNVISARTSVRNWCRADCSHSGRLSRLARCGRVSYVLLAFTPLRLRQPVPLIPTADLVSRVEVQDEECQAFVWYWWDAVLCTVRAIRIGLTFTPLLITYPLTLLSDRLKSFWYIVLVQALQFSGPIYIKLGQWASTRRDLFPEELCNALSYLQRRTKPHSWNSTELQLEKAFGSDWKDLFVGFSEQQPIGSGCCAQVYKAWVDPSKLALKVDNTKLNLLSEVKFSVSAKSKPLEGSSENLVPVAVKVVHPGVQKLLKRDLSIMRGMAKAMTFICPTLKWLALNDCVEEFAQLMSAQTDMRVEASNLEKFTHYFRNNPGIHFPTPVRPFVEAEVLVETYEEGEPIFSHIQKTASDNVQGKLADIIVDMVLKMVFQDNFVHGDLHPGNILVNESSSIPGPLLLDFQKDRPPVSITVLDCGIVTQLRNQDLRNFCDVLTAVAFKKGRRVAELFLEQSPHQCVDPETFKEEMSKIVLKYRENVLSLGQVDASELLSSVFGLLMHHKIRLESRFVSVILAVIVLEGLGRSLDPTLDILEKAKPVLLKCKARTNCCDAFL